MRLFCSKIAPISYMFIASCLLCLPTVGAARGHGDFPTPDPGNRRQETVDKHPTPDTRHPTPISEERGKGKGERKEEEQSKIENRKSKIENLRAGPIRMKFADGELRYLYVGRKEIARRIYFAVRDRNWGTIMPQFTHMDVRRSADGFTIDLEALCRNEAVDYRWKGQITGTPEGVISFKAAGEAGHAFESLRIGLCLLYGSGSLAGQSFQTHREDGMVTKGRFPELVSPDLVAPIFQSLTYTTTAGLEVAAAVTGARFDMEDQRNYGDSSYKAYAPLPYKYPQIKQGEAAEQTLTIQVRNAPQEAAADAQEPTDTPARIFLGRPRDDARVPKLFDADPSVPYRDFMAVNSDRAKYKGAASVRWGLTPAVHLPDDDNFMDNLPTVVDQVETIRSFAPNASIRIEPVTLNSSTPGAGRDPRNDSLFGAAWSAAVIKYLSLAGVNEAGFAIGPGYAQPIRQAIGANAGQRIYATRIEAGSPARIDAYAIEEDGAPVLWLINLTGQPQEASIEHLDKDIKANIRRFDGKSAPAAQPIEPTAGDRSKGTLRTLPVTLQPYEVCEIHLLRD